MMAICLIPIFSISARVAFLRTASVQRLRIDMVLSNILRMSFGVWTVVSICMSVFCTNITLLVSVANIQLFHKLTKKNIHKKIYLERADPTGSEVRMLLQRYNLFSFCQNIFLQSSCPVAADLQSDAKYYQDFQSVKQSLSQKTQILLSTFNYQQL